jgi:hypothetical protein
LRNPDLNRKSHHGDAEKSRKDKPKTFETQRNRGAGGLGFSILAITSLAIPPCLRACVVRFAF